MERRADASQLQKAREALDGSVRTPQVGDGVVPVLQRRCEALGSCSSPALEQERGRLQLAGACCNIERSVVMVMNIRPAVKEQRNNSQVASACGPPDSIRKILASARVQQRLHHSQVTVGGSTP